MQSPWQDPVWRTRADEWIAARLDGLGIAVTGEVEQPHVRVWSTVLKIPTDAGTLWFKANMDSLRHEAAIAELLSARRPDVVMPPLALDHETGWMLMSDAGEQLRTVIPREQSLGRWIDVLGRYAGLQLDLMDSVDALLAAGAPDMRAGGLPERYAQLVGEIEVEQRFRDAVPHVAALCDELAAYGIPDSVQHDDLHDGQVFVKDGRNLVMDWGDACVSHPFLTLSVTLEGVIAWGLDDEEDSEDLTPYRDAYLAPYAARYEGDLVGAVEVARRLGWACRAVNGHVPGDDDPTRTRLRMFLDGRP